VINRTVIPPSDPDFIFQTEEFQDINTLYAINGCARDADLVRIEARNNRTTEVRVCPS